MLDYVRSPVSVLQQLMTELQALMRFQGCILELDGCLYMAHAAALLRALDATSDGPTAPVVIAFVETDSIVATEYASTASVQALLQSLQRLRAALKGLPRPDATASPSRPACPIIDLGALALPCMPTLNGLLLGYPAVYLINDQEQAQLASRHLSSMALTRFSVQLDCKMCAAGGTSMAGDFAMARNALKAAGPRSAGRDCVRELLAFTVPSNLHAGRLAECLKAFMRELRMHAAAWPDVWDVPVMHIAPQNCTPTVL